MSNTTTPITHEATGSATDVAAILRRLQGNPALDSLAQLLTAMAGGNSSASEAVSDATAAEKPADATEDADTTLFADTDAQAAAGEPAEGAGAADADEDDDDDEASSSSSGGIFTDDEIASLLIGFAAG
ncbi:MAG: hypothetical protein GX945_15990, partial [Lentisphaerae bacterium]|nr:hypothetical protein [Lentisphaerota bacterium]